MSPIGPVRSGPLVRCRQLSIGHAGRALLPAFDLDVFAGELLLVVGRNGAGKSTWLKTLLGLHGPVGGEVRFAEPRPQLAYVPQEAALDRILPVRAKEIVGWGELRGWSFLRPLPRRSERRARERALASAGALDLGGLPFRELSGGQRQRVLFARMLASEAELVLLDEPTASMDLASERGAYETLAALVRDRGAGVVVVTHTIGVAAAYADRALFLDRGEERGEPVVASGEPGEVFSHPLFERHFGRPEVSRV